MNESLESRAGGAILWRIAQLSVVSALALLRLVVLARLLAPDDFGLFAIAIAVLGLASSVTDFGLAPALMQLPSPSARQLDAGWTLSVGRGLLLAVLLVTAAGPFAALFHEPRAAPVLRVLALLPLIQSAASIEVVRLMRELDFRPLAVVTVTGAVVHTGVAVGLAPLMGVWALVAGALAGAAISAAWSYVVAPYTPRFLPDRDAVRPLLAFGGWLVAIAVVSAATDFVLRAVIARELGVSGLGVFSLAAGIVFVLLGAASEVHRAVAVPLYARLAGNQAALRRAFRTNTTLLLVVLVPVYAVLGAGAEGLVDHVLGTRWAATEPVLRLLALSCVFWCGTEAAVTLFLGLGVPRLGVVLEIVQFVIVALLAGTLTLGMGLSGAALAWLGAAIASLVPCRGLLRALLGPYPVEGYRLAVILGSGVAAALVTLTAPLVLRGLAAVVVGMPLGLGVAALILRRADTTLRLGLLADLRSLFPASRAPPLGAP